jgi:hypothetical protein
MPTLIFKTPSGFHFRRRAIGFLEGEGWLDAGRTFNALHGNEEQDVRNRIDHWLSGAVHDKYHHGFPNDPRHRECYVFKHQSLRFYGFLCNPKPKTDAGFRLCVLTEAATKYQWSTESTILDHAMQMLADLRAIEAIAKEYPEYGKGGMSWKN